MIAVSIAIFWYVRRYIPSTVIFRSLVLAIATLTALGCGEGGQAAETASQQGVTLPAKLTFTVVNSTKDALKDVMIEGFSYNIKFSVLPSGASSTLLGTKPMDMASRMTVSWTSPKGTRQNSQPIMGTLPRNFNGTLYFTIKPRRKVDFRAGTR